jgi:hypothetical protein
LNRLSIIITEGPALSAQVGVYIFSRGERVLTETATMTLLLKSLGYGIPAAMLVFMLAVVIISMKYLQKKSDKDRREHMVKWDSMLAMQNKAIDAQKESTLAVVHSHKEEITRIVDTHKEEMNRMFVAQQQQSKTLESLAHNLSVITSKIEQQAICPKDIKEIKETL